MIREIFDYAKRNSPCIVFIDEIDAIGGKRQADASSADREVQRTLIELLKHNEINVKKSIILTQKKKALYLKKPQNLR